ncbi:DUF5908 family protein [Spirosoma validum]|uniref:Uncharacterized protein n=1 Tax=Spirosoma validum TaxID=2771355 RepID=A0A927B0D0_9BACT|nr:DUF5908 family protein [Spirosoma validum]MBD2753199.1 hypothetical protein [Spirosoma validum]
MPVEIRELAIKINLSDEGGASAGTAGAESGQEAQQALIEAVVDKVLMILREQEER